MTVLPNTLTEYLENEIHIIKGIKEKRKDTLAYRLSLPEEERREDKCYELLEEIRWCQGYEDACRVIMKEVSKRREYMRVYA